MFRTFPLLHRNPDNTTPGPAPISTFIRTPDEVYTVLDILLKWFPLELADAIMDEAGYWATIISRADTSTLPDYWYVQERYNNYFCCVYTPRLPDWQARNGNHCALRIKRICFTMNSCDQGWTTDLGPFRSSYDSSFSGFQAVVARNFEDPQAASQQSNQSNSDQPSAHQANAQNPPVDISLRIQRALNTRPPRGKLASAADSIANMWNIQNNCRASPFFREHRVVWSAADKPDPPTPMISQVACIRVLSDRMFYPETGAYRAAGFVQSLKPGDRIAIVMRALKPIWQNIAESASIEIVYSR